MLVWQPEPSLPEERLLSVPAQAAELERALQPVSRAVRPVEPVAAQRQPPVQKASAVQRLALALELSQPARQVPEPWQRAL